ncbi:PUA domain-containing protein [Methanothermococcus sp.]|uniref:PUA domain-containing protein n=1 Tax=Methanothermococcus sp. TaxID=2614238 RepID=UPI0025D6134C|nr:NIP7 N-terminal domain-related protein [Methanothermococcus sp.]
MKHRPLNSEEVKSVKNILINYIGKNIENFKFENLYVLEDKENYEVMYANKEVFETLKNFDRNIYGAGILFGNFEIKRSNNENKIKFSISLEGMSLISKDIIKNYVVVTKKGETLFLYGRDVFKSSILEINGGGKIAVFNKNKELLGVGNYGGGDIIKNIIDKGWYLRKGG